MSRSRFAASHVSGSFRPTSQVLAGRAREMSSIQDVTLISRGAVERPRVVHGDCASAIPTQAHQAGATSR
jgi:hypothetical protein